MKIIIVGRDSFNRKLQSELAGRFMNITCFTSPITALEGLRQQDLIDLVIIEKQDWPIAGSDLENLIKQTTSARQVIILTKEQDSRCIFSHLKTLGKIKITRPLAFTGFVYQKQSSSLYVDGAKIPMAPKEWELLSFLLSFQNRCISKESIINKVWGHRFLCRPQTLTTHLNILRKKLKQFNVQIRTIHSYGYKLVGPN